MLAQNLMQNRMFQLLPAPLINPCNVHTYIYLILQLYSVHLSKFGSLLKACVKLCTFCDAP